MRRHLGITLVLIPFIILALGGFAALVVDVAWYRVAGAQLQNAVDAGSLAGAFTLPQGTTAAQNAAINFTNQNKIIGNLSPQNVVATVGTWNGSAFTSGGTSPNAVQVTASVTPPMFFSGLLSAKALTLSQSSVSAANFLPRDIMFLVDLTPNMSFYSQLAATQTICGSSTLTSSCSFLWQNIQNIYNALGILGSSSKIANWSWPAMAAGKITVKGKQVQATTVCQIETFFNMVPNGATANYPYGAGNNSCQTNETCSNTNSLTTDPWGQYICYVQNDPTVKSTGFQNMYGPLTFTNYLLVNFPTFTQTSTLWKTPEYPLQAVKSALSSLATNGGVQGLHGNCNAGGVIDEIGLITFDDSSGSSAVLEQGLTCNFSGVASILTGSGSTPGRQAAHYGNGYQFLPDTIIDAAIQLVSDHRTVNNQPVKTKIMYLISPNAFSDTPISFFVIDFIFFFTKLI